MGSFLSAIGLVQQDQLYFLLKLCVLQLSSTQHHGTKRKDIALMIIVVT